MVGPAAAVTAVRRRYGVTATSAVRTPVTPDVTLAGLAVSVHVQVACDLGRGGGTNGRRSAQFRASEYQAGPVAG
jgi:hypothetical protein